MVILTKLINKFKATSIRIPASLLVEMDKLILKFIRNCKELRIIKTILKKRNIVGGITLSNFKMY